MCLNYLFQLALFGRQLVKIGIRIGIECIHFIKTFQRTHNFRYGLFDGLANGLLQIQLGFLRQIADFQTRLWASFTFNIGIDAGHNAQQG